MKWAAFLALAAVAGLGLAACEDTYDDYGHGYYGSDYGPYHHGYTYYGRGYNNGYYGRGYNNGYYDRGYYDGQGCWHGDRNYNGRSYQYYNDED